MEPLHLKLDMRIRDYVYLIVIGILLNTNIDVDFGLEWGNPFQKSETVTIQNTPELGSFPIPMPETKEEKSTPSETPAFIPTSYTAVVSPPVVSEPETPPVETSFETVVTHLALNDSRAAGYVSKYHQWAKEEEAKFNIPASITLAQGMRECDKGNSYLAREANNHFGVKYYSKRHIPESLRKYVSGYVNRHDDCCTNRRCNKPDKFVKYTTAWASYRHHSYVVNRKRYRKYNPKTYNEWAWAFKWDKGGYATSKTYHQDLIRDIKKYRLHLLDKQ